MLVALGAGEPVRASAGTLFREETFEELWFGAPAESARTWVRACPGCWAECEVLPSAVYSGDIFKHALTARGSVRRPKQSPA